MNEEILRIELSRLNDGFNETEVLPEKVGEVYFVVDCIDSPQQVLSKARSVLIAIDDVLLQHQPWPADDQWRLILPAWFLDRCALDMSAEQALRWLEWWKAQTPEKQQEIESTKKWSFANWIYWMKPEQREWFWRDATIENAQIVRVSVDVIGWPFSWAAMSWLFRSAGALSVKEEETV